MTEIDVIHYADCRDSHMTLESSMLTLRVKWLASLCINFPTSQKMNTVSIIECQQLMLLKDKIIVCAENSMKH